VCVCLRVRRPYRLSVIVIVVVVVVVIVIVVVDQPSGHLPWFYKKNYPEQVRCNSNRENTVKDTHRENTTTNLTLRPTHINADAA